MTLDSLGKEHSYKHGRLEGVASANLYITWRDRYCKISDFLCDGDRGPINICGVGTQTPQISIIHQLHRGLIRGNAGIE